MSNTLLQDPAVVGFSNASSASKAFASAGTSGSRYVACITQENSAGTFSVSDDQNGAWTEDVTASENQGFSGSIKTSIFSVQNASAAIATITVTLGAASYGVLKIFELSASDLDSNAQGGGNNTTVPSIDLTTLADNCSIFAVGGSNANPGTSADTGFTQSFTTTPEFSFYHFGERLMDAGAASTRTLTMGGISNAQWAFVAAAYKAAAAGGGATVVPKFEGLRRNVGRLMR